MNELSKYNYYVVLAKESELVQYGSNVVANESIIIQMSDEMKTDIEQMKNRDEIIRNIILNTEIGYCIGFNFIGKVGNNWNTKVFYYNPRKAYFDNLFKK